MNPTSSVSKYLDARALEERYGIERTTLWRRYRRGEFPLPLYFGRKRVWPVEAIEAWERANLSAVPAIVPTLP